MGYGASACWAYAISKEDIIKIVGKIAEDFFNFFDENTDDNLDEFAKQIVTDFSGFDEEKFETAEKLYEQMLSEFELKTGLGLEILHHFEDEGDRYDDVRGTFFNVIGAYQLSPEAKKLMDSGINIQTVGYVVYG